MKIIYTFNFYLFIYYYYYYFISRFSQFSNKNIFNYNFSLFKY